MNLLIYTLAKFVQFQNLVSRRFSFCPSLTITPVSNPTSTQPGNTLWIGRAPTEDVLGAYVFHGVLDDIRIYNRALSSNEVSQLYALESAPILNIRQAVYVDSSNLWVGTNYQLQVSTDLNTWTNSGTPFTATNSSWRSPNYWDVDNWGSLFFRLKTNP
jgi:hypothetical protein